jgi:hypothetical protein
MPRHISLSDVVINRVCCLVSFRISFRDWIPICGCACRGLLSRGAARPGLARPSPPRPGLGPRTPGALPLPMRAPPPLVSLPLIQISRAQLPLSPISLSPHGALGFGDGDHWIWTSR